MNILAMVAHPDDEVLGAGGTLAKHVKAGDEVHIASLTDGVEARGITADAAGRASMAIEAAKVLGAKQHIFRTFPDNRLDHFDLLDIVHAVETIVKNLSPTIIYTHHSGDLNIDHRICNQAVLTACRPMPGSGVKAIYAMEIPSSTEWEVPTTFQPNRFVDITEVMSIKVGGLNAYKEEMRSPPHPRSYEGVYSLAKWRGTTAGLDYAEAFMVLREIA